MYKVYKERISILLGYEYDYIFGEMDETILEDPELDYLIGSVHFIDKTPILNQRYADAFKGHDRDLLWEKYFAQTALVAKTGKFQIIGHLDLLKVLNIPPKKDIRLLAKPALQAIKKANTAVEINSSGWRKKVAEQYPSRPLLEMIYDMQIPITFGSDAHAPEHVGMFQEESLTLAKSIGFDQCVYFEKKERITVSL